MATQPAGGLACDALSSVTISWLTFVRVLCVDWLAAPAFSRVVLRDVCLEALLGSLRPLDGRVGDSAP